MHGHDRRPRQRLQRWNAVLFSNAEVTLVASERLDIFFEHPASFGFAVDDIKEFDI